MDIEAFIFHLGINCRLQPGSMDSGRALTPHDTQSRETGSDQAYERMTECRPFDGDVGKPRQHKLHTRLRRC